MKKTRGYWVNIYPKELQSQEPNFFETEDEAKKMCNRRFLIDRVFIGIEYNAQSEAAIEGKLAEFLEEVPA